MEETVQIISEIKSLIEIWEPRLLSLDKSLLGNKRNKQDRTIKQILGHLIDSASNNIHRVVHLQYQESPFEFPNYASFGNNDRWIAIQNYQNEDWNLMVNHWKYSFLHYCHVISNINNSCSGNEWIAGPDRKFTLKEMIVDFPRHLNLHLSEIEELIE